MLNKESILAASDFITKAVDVPEWGGTVLVRGLSSLEKDAFESRLAQSQDLTNIRASVAVMAMVDEDGKRIFTDKDATALGAKNATVVARVFDAIRELSGMGDEVMEQVEGN